MVKVSFELNGQQVTCEVDAQEVLVDTVRNRFGLTGTKKGCGTGDCGSCTVILDGKAVRSCTLLTCMVDGKKVVTIEGVGTKEHLHPLQQAFIDVGAVQCGYCIPGMILAGKALLDENPSPTREEIRVALAGNFCRCTGYTKIFEAIEKAAEVMRGEA